MKVSTGPHGARRRQALRPGVLQNLNQVLLPIAGRVGRDNEEQRHRSLQNLTPTECAVRWTTSTHGIPSESVDQRWVDVNLN